MSVFVAAAVLLAGAPLTLTVGVTILTLSGPSWAQWPAAPYGMWLPAASRSKARHRGPDRRTFGGNHTLRSYADRSMSAERRRGRDRRRDVGVS